MATKKPDKKNPVMLSPEFSKKFKQDVQMNSDSDKKKKKARVKIGKPKRVK